MAVLEILQIGHPFLRVPAREVSRDELRTAATQGFIDDLIETMRAANGAGLAATQVHRDLRICAIEVGDNPRYPYKPKVPLTVLVNPVLEPMSGSTFDNYEGCLSVPNLRGLVPRHAELRVRALDREGRAIDTVIRGITAGTYQHECDHLDGRLFVDRVTDTTSLTTWEQFERHHRDAFVARVHEIVAQYGS
jgi:peptide deformylase